MQAPKEADIVAMNETDTGGMLIFGNEHAVESCVALNKGSKIRLGSCLGPLD